MPIRAELPIGRPAILNEYIPEDMLVVAGFALIGGAIALGLAIAFPIPGDTDAPWLVQFPG
jgi:hypothetical protein